MDIIMYGNRVVSNDLDMLLDTVREIEMLTVSVDEDRHYIAYLPDEYELGQRTLENFETLVGEGKYTLVLQPNYVKDNTPNIEAGNPELTVEYKGLADLIVVSTSDKILFIEIGDKLLSGTRSEIISKDFELSGTIVDSYSLHKAMLKIIMLDFIPSDVLKGIILAYSKEFKLLENFALFNLKVLVLHKSNLSKLNEKLIELSKTSDINTISDLILKTKG